MTFIPMPLADALDRAIEAEESALEKLRAVRLAAKSEDDIRAARREYAKAIDARVAAAKAVGL